MRLPPRARAAAPRPAAPARSSVVIRVERTTAPPESWQDLCLRDPHATLYLFPRWTEALLRAYPEYRPLYLVAVEDGRVAGLLPMVRRRRFGLDQYLSLPFGGHGGPVLAADAPPETVPALARAFARLVFSPRVIRFEMTVFRPSASLEEGLTPDLGRTFQQFRTHLVDLRPGFDEIWAHAYDKNTRNCVRMAERAGVTVAEETGEEALQTLYRLHRDQARAWPGVHAHPLRAIRAVRDTLGADARIYVARREGKPLVACLYLEHLGREIHPWVIGTAPEARPVRASHMLHHTVMRDACERGIQTWDFGGSGGIRGVEFFKESMGGRPVPVLRCFHVAGWMRRLRRGPVWD